MDKTLSDYIKRTQKMLEEEDKPTDPQKDVYEVYPENDGYDKPCNPFSPV